MGLGQLHAADRRGEVPLVLRAVDDAEIAGCRVPGQAGHARQGDVLGDRHVERGADHHPHERLALGVLGERHDRGRRHGLPPLVRLAELALVLLVELLVGDGTARQVHGAHAHPVAPSVPQARQRTRFGAEPRGKGEPGVGHLGGLLRRLRLVHDLAGTLRRQRPAVPADEGLVQVLVGGGVGLRARRARGLEVALVGPRLRAGQRPAVAVGAHELVDALAPVQREPLPGGGCLVEDVEAPATRDVRRVQPRRPAAGVVVLVRLRAVELLDHARRPVVAGDDEPGRPQRRERRGVGRHRLRAAVALLAHPQLVVGSGERGEQVADLQRRTVGVELVDEEPSGVVDDQAAVQQVRHLHARRRGPVAVGVVRVGERPRLGRGEQRLEGPTVPALEHPDLGVLADARVVLDEDVDREAEPAQQLGEVGAAGDEAVELGGDRLGRRRGRGRRVPRVVGPVVEVGGSDEREGRALRRGHRVDAQETTRGVCVGAQPLEAALDRLSVPALVLLEQRVGWGERARPGRAADRA